MTLLIYPDSENGKKMLMHGGWADYHEMGFIKRYLRTHDHTLDVGANIGSYTLLLASCVGSSGGVDAFEPTPKNLRRLRENVAFNNLTNVKIHEQAVSNKDAMVSFRVDGDTQNGIELPHFRSCDKTRTIFVQSVTLDRTFLRHRKYALAKIDVEGAEYDVLHGARHGLSRGNPPVLLIELRGHEERYGCNASDIARFLRDRGYDFALYDYDDQMLTFTGNPWRSSSDFFAIARSKRDFVLSRLANRSKLMVTGRP
ncbi:MAG: FkbM family methyltransferase [Acidiferrobacterales bacterium]